MKDSHEIVKIIRQMIADGNFDDAFDLFQKFLNNSVESEKIKTEGLLLTARYNNLKKEKLLGILSDSDSKLTNLCHSLLVFLQTLESTSGKDKNEQSVNEKLSELRKRLLSATNLTEIERIQHECRYLVNLYPDSFDAVQLQKRVDESVTWYDRKNDENRKVYPQSSGSGVSILILIIALVLVFFIVYKGCIAFGEGHQLEDIDVPQNEPKVVSQGIEKVNRTNFDSLANLMASYFLMDSIMYLDLLDSLTYNNKHDLAITAFEKTLQKTLRKDKIKNANDFIKSLKLAQERGFDRVYWDFPTLNNLILTEKDDKFGLFSSNGDEIVSPKYDEINPMLFSTLLATTLGDGYGFLNNKGIEIIPPVLSNIFPMEDVNLILVEENLHFGALDTFGRIIIPIKYEEIDLPDDFGYLRVKQYDKWGFLDCKGKNVVPVKFDTISPFTKNVALTIHKGEVRYINRKGAFVKNPIFE